ncbi:PTS system nitrogen regulatory protein IIA(Ntr) [Catenovulum agarivorans DS-2]|uniref:PTS system nitrogen regulatory protein IIA(Ntr) n=1 Tax=Catenovulum agarivorans DS-2 TaxID=1328313 RepID=W7QAZ3_9ALTE|nr:PTS IIA-like nitrogen regulatory protein PtsN [Catenovulum agarivorans]EWH09126.1 PTS system nitrogen regulatory protein IIA(Ntr) [Catenovulum agarivorans DS-2]
MDIQSFLTQDCTECAVTVSSKKRIIEHIGQIASQHIDGLSEQEITTALLNRERLGSTGIGNGIALPHGRLANTTTAIAVLITTSNPIDYDAIDNQPVNVFFALLVPEDQCNEHLKSLAAVAKKLSDKSILKRIRTAQNNQELYQAITE